MRERERPEKVEEERNRESVKSIWVVNGNGGINSIWG